MHKIKKSISVSTIPVQQWFGSLTEGKKKQAFAIEKLFPCSRNIPKFCTCNQHVSSNDNFIIQ